MKISEEIFSKLMEDASKETKLEILESILAEKRAELEQAPETKVKQGFGKLKAGVAGKANALKKRLPKIQVTVERPNKEASEDVAD